MFILKIIQQKVNIIKGRSWQTFLFLSPTRNSGNFLFPSQGDAPFPFKTEVDQDPSYKDSRSNSTGTVVVTTAQVHHPNQEVNLEQVSS